jgi:ribosomal protein S18 acetylase RimI-like enzyme
VTRLRPATPADLPALTELQRAYDTAFFGEPEHDVDEVREWLDLGDVTCVVQDGAAIVGAAIKHRTGSAALVGPATDRAGVAARLVSWLAEVGAPNTEALERDAALRDALAAAGWRHDYSSFELFRAVGGGWQRPAAQWPDGVQVRRFAPGQEDALHALIYTDAGWADVRGHYYRDRAEWARLFLTGRTPDERPVLAWRGDRPVGAVLVRLFSDRTGWIAQLAVARTERGRGLGRALLLEGLDRLAAAGATKLGLAVVAGNRAALALYLDVGLEIDREWQTFVPAGAGTGGTATGGTVT